MSTWVPSFRTALTTWHIHPTWEPTGQRLSWTAHVTSSLASGSNYSVTNYRQATSYCDASSFLTKERAPQPEPKTTTFLANEQPANCQLCVGALVRGMESWGEASFTRWHRQWPGPHYTKVLLGSASCLTSCRRSCSFLAKW